MKVCNNPEYGRQIARNGGDSSNEPIRLVVVLQVRRRYEHRRTVHAGPQAVVRHGLSSITPILKG